MDGRIDADVQPKVDNILSWYECKYDLCQILHVVFEQKVIKLLEKHRRYRFSGILGAILAGMRVR